MPVPIIVAPIGNLSEKCVRSL